AIERIPTIYTAHGLAFCEQAPLVRKLPAWIGEWVGARAGHHTIAVSQAESLLAGRYRVSPSTHVVYNGVVEPARRAVPDAEPPVIAMVARFAYPKQQESLLRAFQ